MKQSVAQKLCAELGVIRKELVEEVRRLQPENLDWAPQPGMKTYRELLEEIGGVEWGCRLWASELPDWSASWHERITGAGSAQELLQLLEEVRAQTLDYLRECSEEELRVLASVPENSQQYAGGPMLEKEEIFRWIARHEYYHLGQIIIYGWLRGDNPYQRSKQEKLGK